MSDQVAIAIIWALVISGAAFSLLWFCVHLVRGDFKRQDTERSIIWRERMAKLERQLEHKNK